ncbi:MAG: LD-carboxypeptidase [Oscillospiraceae bacterium]|nr:LD-carboxypeptidase [Oscillospiraceae bacterium]
MNVAVFYPCRPYCTDKDVTEEIVSNSVESLYPVLNHPPYDSTLSKRDDFLRLLHEPSIESLMVWRGGRIDDSGSLWKSSLGLLKDLTKSDWKWIEKHPKNIIGYSDATYLLCALVSHEINCFYGPNYNSTLQCSTDDELNTTLEYLSLALKSNNDYVIDFSEEKLTLGQHSPWTLAGGIATGRLVGGNLNTIYQLLNLKEHENVFTIHQGDILFLEECDPNYVLRNNTVMGSMHEQLMFLEKAGVFSKISGLLFGRSKIPTVYDPDNNLFYVQVDNSQERNYFEKCIQSFIPTDIPILANVACSHTHPMVTLPLGRKVTLDSNAQTLTVH